MRVWTARHAFISYACPQQMNLAAEICQSFALDNGAFTLWKRGGAIDWDGYYAWVDEWRSHPGCDFAVVPDVIEGTEDENDALAAEWPFPKHQGAVVWHINESLARLKRLSREWPRVCIGSAGEWDVSMPRQFLGRATQVIGGICDARGRPPCKLHGLRMLNPAIYTRLPLASADSTNVARNIGIDAAWKGTYQPKSKETRAAILVERIESENSTGELT